jgi:hypothetical protein
MMAREGAKHLLTSPETGLATIIRKYRGVTVYQIVLHGHPAFVSILSSPVFPFL